MIIDGIRLNNLKQFMQRLGYKNYYANPVGYVLWAEFFLDEASVNETWAGLMQHIACKKTVKKLLKICGPVPFLLKEKLYQPLIGNQEFHESIFKSLLFISVDLFGKTDQKKALAILTKLNLPKNTLHINVLKENLQ